MGIYRLHEKKITRDYPWVKRDVLHIQFDWWPSSEFFNDDLVASGYVETEAQYKARSMKPESFYINGKEV